MLGHESHDFLREGVRLTRHSDEDRGVRISDDIEKRDFPRARARPRRHAIRRLKELLLRRREPLESVVQKPRPVDHEQARACVGLREALGDTLAEACIVITGRASPAMRRRATELGVTLFDQHTLRGLEERFERLAPGHAH